MPARCPPGCGQGQKSGGDRTPQIISFSDISHKRSLLMNVELDGPFIYSEIADPNIVDLIKVLNVIALDSLESRLYFKYSTRCHKKMFPWILRCWVKNWGFPDSVLRFWSPSSKEKEKCNRSHP